MTVPAAPSIAPITLAIATALETTGRPIGRNGAPAAPGLPYSFLTRLGTTWSGSMANAAEMVAVVYQATCVGLSDEQVEWMDAAARRVLAEPPVVAGWEFVEWLVPEGDPGVRPDDDDPAQRLLFTIPQWRLIAMPTFQETL